MVTVSIDQARQIRRQIQYASEFFTSNEKAFSEFGDSIEWDDLKSLPAWIFLNQDEIEKIVLISGTIFLLPSIRIWIDARKIQEIRLLIGDSVFDYIMTNINTNNQQVHSLDMEDVQINLRSSGAAVIISSHSLKYRPWLKDILPEPKGKLDTALASDIFEQAIRVYSQSITESDT
jgi:hypothetical protein